MALHWDFKHPAGKVEQTQYGQTFTMDLYEGNAFLIAVHEFKGEDGTDLYEVGWFFLDEAHAKRCLGLAKRADGTKHNMFEADTFHNLTLYRDGCSNWAKVANTISKAFPHIAITIMEKPET